MYIRLYLLCSRSGGQDEDDALPDPPVRRAAMFERQGVVNARGIVEGSAASSVDSPGSADAMLTGKDQTTHAPST
jgi:hypothetical protein